MNRPLVPTLLLVLIAGACASAPPRIAETPAPPSAERVAAARVAPAVEVPVAADPAAPSAVAAAKGVRTIGRCDESEGDVAHITLAHLNDLQARYSDRLEGKSRYGYIAGYLRALKDEVPATLVLDAGDDYEKGAIAELRSMGESTRQMVQALPIDVRTIGNHDFAYGEAQVVKDVTESAHPVIASNIRYDKDPDLFAPFVRVDVGCVKIGVVGVVAHSYGADDLPSREPFDGVFVQDNHYADVVGEVVRAHRAEVDVMIALNHIGLFADTQLAEKVPGLDVVIGGHTENLLRAPHVVGRRDGSRAYVLQAGHWGRTLGRADLRVDLGAAEHKVQIEHYRIVDVTPSLPFADDVGALAERLEAESVPDAHRPIATLTHPLWRGAPLANLVWRAVQDRWGAEALIVGHDDFWAPLAAGPVTLQALYDTVLVQREPSGTSGFTSLRLVSVRGAELAEARRRFKPGKTFLFYGPTSIAADKTYKVAIEKRAHEVPRTAFFGGVSPLTAKAPEKSGELVDVLEAYARAQTAAGKAL